uniref:Uncharacterized protein n=1 Tax=Romanomermis culicivorax TaxID=13658 RepID=A0A915IU61_ROMCU
MPPPLSEKVCSSEVASSHSKSLAARLRMDKGLVGVVVKKGVDAENLLTTAAAAASENHTFQVKRRKAAHRRSLPFYFGCGGDFSRCVFISGKYRARRLFEKIFSLIGHRRLTMMQR